MLNKPTDIPDINPVSRIMPVLATSRIGSLAQDLDFRAMQFIKGQEYFGHVMAKADDKTMLVKVNDALLKMDLGGNAQPGQTVQLKYLQDEPLPTFALLKSTISNDNPLSTPAQLTTATSLLGKNQAITTALPPLSALPLATSQSDATIQLTLSPTASLIDRTLQQAALHGEPTRLQVQGVVTHNPQLPAQVAQALQQTIRQSGLFYESHLADAVQTGQSLRGVANEPQNLQQAAPPQLLAQQLSVLETRHIAWQGEVWPNQRMDWDIQVHEKPHRDGDNQHSQHSDGADDHFPVTSQLSLTLPNLGKVTAKLHWQDGHFRIQLSAEAQPTIAKLRHHSPQLAKQITQRGQHLDQLQVASASVG